MDQGWDWHSVCGSRALLTQLENHPGNASARGSPLSDQLASFFAGL